MRETNEPPSREVLVQDALAYTESIVDTFREPLLVLDGGLQVHCANRAFYRAFQLLPEETEGVSIYHLTGGHWNLPQLHTLLEQVLPFRKFVEDFEVEYTTADLRYRVMLFNARKLFCHGNETEIILLAIEDITDRKRTERALAESEKQRRLIMDSAPAMIGYVDPNLRFRLVNNAYQRWFGVAPETLIGKTLTDLFGSDFFRTIQPYVDRVMAGETVAFEEDYPGIDGSRTLQVTYTPDLDERGGVQGFVVLGTDITARKKAELAVRKSEERWRSLFERMTEGFFVGQMIYNEAGEAIDFQFVEVNPAFETLTGLSQAAGKTIRQIVSDVPSGLIQRYARVVETGEPAHFETLFSALRDSWYEVRARHTGEQCFAVLFLNITERKAAEAQLLENERRQAALVALGDRLRDPKDSRSLALTAMEIVGKFLQVARAGYGTVDPTGAYVTVKDDWTDGTVSTLAGIYRFSDFGENLGASLQQGKAFVVSDVTVHSVTARDSARWQALDIRAVVILPLVENGRLSAILFVQETRPRTWTESDLAFLQKVADRTWAAAERARALSELQESEEFTRSILASSPDSVKVMDMEGRVLTINESGCKQMEIDNLAAVLNQPWADLWGESRALADAALTAVKQGHTHRFEGFCATLKGTPKWWEVAVTPIRDAAGVPVRILSLSRDITERKRADQERERLTRELQRSNEDLSQFAHTVAHDLQSPLRGVTGFAQLLKKSGKNNFGERELEFLDHIVVSARRMGDLVQGLLQFAQIGQGEIARKPVPMNAIVDSALESLQLQIEEQAATVTCTSLPVVTGDSIQLVQLLQNLIGNALKYRRAEAPPVISVTASQDGQHHVFSVKDNGQGIAPEYLKQIFEPLKRLHGAEIPGTGLGLSTCHRIVARHGGAIWVKSQPQAGSTFFFTLPTQSAIE